MKARAWLLAGLLFAGCAGTESGNPSEPHPKTTADGGGTAPADASAPSLDAGNKSRGADAGASSSDASSDASIDRPDAGDGSVNDGDGGVDDVDASG
ncbi:MAG: hypothetical protein OEZ06_09235 [Myxococcales bacterium]|nr:hypothetical protein [Myxococcales bacterium]